VNEVSLLFDYQVVAAILFGLGLIGMLTRRNLIVIFLCAEMMLQGVALSLVAWSRFHHDWGGQSFVIFIIVVAGCEAGIALALILMLAKRTGSLDVTLWQELREETQGAYVDREVPEERAEDRVWPKLPTAGVQPAIDEERIWHRPRV
jgi:NADH-quinone oxidoreductase subunit K